MAFAPLILRFNPTIGGVDVSDQVSSIMFRGSRDSIVIPATAGKRKSYAPGDDDYEVVISFLQDVDPTALTIVFYEAMATEAGTLEVAATMRSGAVSAANREWQGTALITEFGDIGGTINSVGQASVTFPLLDRPNLDDGT